MAKCVQCEGRSECDGAGGRGWERDPHMNVCVRARGGGAGGTDVRVAKRFWVRESSHIGRKRSCTATHKADKHERKRIADRVFTDILLNNCGWTCACDGKATQIRANGKPHWH